MHHFECLLPFVSISLLLNMVQWRRMTILESSFVDAAVYCMCEHCSFQTEMPLFRYAFLVCCFLRMSCLQSLWKIESVIDIYDCYLHFVSCGLVVLHWIVFVFCYPCCLGRWCRMTILESSFVDAAATCMCEHCSFQTEIPLFRYFPVRCSLRMSCVQSI